MRLLVLMLAGCGGTDNGKTLVYALDGEAEGRLDRSRCATGVGLNVPLGISGSLGYAVAQDGRDAVLITCDLDDAGEVGQCFTLTPEVVLTIDDDNNLVGTNRVSVAIDNSECEGAWLDSEWTIELNETGMDATVVSIWHLEPTSACEDFEADVIRASNSGLGIEDCELTHTMSGVFVGRY